MLTQVMNFPKQCNVEIQVYSLFSAAGLFAGILFLVQVQVQVQVFKEDRCKVNLPLCIVQPHIQMQGLFREALLYQNVCFFKHCQKGEGGGQTHVQKIYVADLV